MKTELLYMANMSQMQCTAVILEYRFDGDKAILVLNQTVLYPQGGGQPYDTGTIKSFDRDFVFRVQEVRLVEGVVNHIGMIECGKLCIGMDVHCHVEEERRKLNTRLHSAGHLIDMALTELGTGWIPGKGYHFPQGAYVEFSGNIEWSNIEIFRRNIEEKANEIIARDIETSVLFEDNSIQNSKRIRTVFYGDYGVPCGGTHVSSLREIKSICIRKIKREKDAIRISYSV